MRIALDAMGGDNAPGPNILGALQAAAQSDELHVALVGDPTVLESNLADAGGDPTGRISIVAADGVVGMEEKPTVALRQKPNCSIARCWQLMAGRDVDAVVSAGNTGCGGGGGAADTIVSKGRQTSRHCRDAAQPKRQQCSG